MSTLTINSVIVQANGAWSMGTCKLPPQNYSTDATALGLFISTLTISSVIVQASGAWSIGTCKLPPQGYSTDVQSCGCGSGVLLNRQSTLSSLWTVHLL